MSGEAIHDILEDCLTQAGPGQSTADEGTSAHCAADEELRQLLEIARAIPPRLQVTPDLVFWLRGRARLIEAISDDRNAGRSSPLRRLWRQVSGGWEQQPQPVRRMAMLAPIVTLVLVLTTFTGSGAVEASQETFPGVITRLQ